METDCSAAAQQGTTSPLQQETAQASQDAAQQQPHSEPLEVSPDLLSNLHSQLMFYRTSYKLSAQQLALPRGMYALPPGEALDLQLFFALHPDAWDSDKYVSARAAALQALAMPSTTAAAAAAAQAGSPPAAAPAAPAGPTAAFGSNSDDEEGGSHQGSCSPVHCSDTSPSRQPGSSSNALSLAGVAAAAAAVAAAAHLQAAQGPLHRGPEPEGQLGQSQEAQSQELLCSTAALGAWAEGFAPESTLLGPFPAQVKASTGAKEGLCKIIKVQHGGQLKGIWHSSNHKLVLYEKVGANLIMHLQSRQAGDAGKKRRPAKMYSLPGAGYGRQVCAGSITEVDMCVKLTCSKSGTVPLKLPKALVLSQFNVDSVPCVVPLDLVVDGQPAELTMQVQSASGGGGSTSIRVQREAKISQLPRHTAYCLAGLASAGLGAYTGYTVTKVSAPGGEKIVLHLSSPAAMAAAAAAENGAAGAPAAAAAGATDAAEGSAAPGSPHALSTVTADGGQASSDGAHDQAQAAGHAGDGAAADTCTAGQAATAAGSAGAGAAEWQSRYIDGVRVQQLLRFNTPEPQSRGDAPTAAAGDDKGQVGGGPWRGESALSHRTFWLQRLTLCKQVCLSPTATAAPGNPDTSDAAGPSSSAFEGQTAQQDGDKGCAEAGGQAPAAAAVAAGSKAPNGPSVASKNSRLEMFKAIMQRQQQQQQHKMHGLAPVSTAAGDSKINSAGNPKCSGSSSGISSLNSCCSSATETSSAAFSPAAARDGPAGAVTVAPVRAASPETPTSLACLQPATDGGMLGANTSLERCAERVGYLSPQLHPAGQLQQQQPGVLPVSGGMSSRKRGCQRSRLGPLWCSGTAHPPVEAGSSWGCADAAAHINSKRQKRSHAL